LNGLTFFISIPAARRIVTPLFFYFGIFDDIYLYQFHDRLYGDTMNAVFNMINNVQIAKWSLFNYQSFLNSINVDIGVFQNITDYQDAYNSYQFTDADHTEVGSEGLWANCQNFFIVALPITLIGYLFARMLFRILFNYSISKWIRTSEFWVLLFLLLLDGNIQ
jgi:hypothetical protein